jgi:hypothetical protein
MAHFVPPLVETEANFAVALFWCVVFYTLSTHNAFICVVLVDALKRATVLAGFLFGLRKPEPFVVCHFNLLLYVLYR